MTTTALPLEPVRAAPFRAHLGLLIDGTGLPWPVLALKAGIPVPVVRQLMFGSHGRQVPRLPADTARRLFELDAEQFRMAAITWVPARETVRVLSRLLAEGCPVAALARYCRLSQSQLVALLDAPRCTELTALLARSARIQFGPSRNDGAARARHPAIPVRTPRQSPLGSVA